ncbi:MAG: acyl-CoA thioesterase [Chloroflexi bacterium]|nr:acyl-CoA thioesterase [Chloroflexota bacterium]
MLCDLMETRNNYPYYLDIPTRWLDNDLYQHVNNVHYYAFFDTVIGRFLMDEAGLDYRQDAVVGFAVENGCHYKRPLAFPDIVEAGLRVTKIGNSSVRYEVGLFTAGHDSPAATGYFVHVFVNRFEGNIAAPIPPKIRAALSKIHQSA